MTSLAVVPIDNTPGIVTTPSLTVPDADTALHLSFSNWSQVSASISLAVEISLDGGGVWLPLGTVNATGGPVDPRGPASVTFSPLPMLCQCGVYYLPGVIAYNRSLDHSTVALKPGVTLQQLGQVVTRPVVSTAALLKWIIVDRNGIDVDDRYVVRTFHVPTPGTNPARRIRATVTIAGGRVTSTLTVTSS